MEMLAVEDKDNDTHGSGEKRVVSAVKVSDSYFNVVSVSACCFNVISISQSCFVNVNQINVIQFSIEIRPLDRRAQQNGEKW